MQLNRIGAINQHIAGELGFSNGIARAVAQPVYGNLNVLLLPVQFSDLVATTSLDSLRSKALSLESYYREVSYGQVDLNFSLPFSSWFTLPDTLDYYGHDSALVIDVNLDQFILNSLSAAAPYVNYSRYDYVMIVHAGDDQARTGSSTDIWSSTPSLGKTYPYDGVLLAVSVLSEYDPYGVYAHEFGHNLELPDLYDVDYQQNFVGRLSLMSSGSWLSPPSSIMAPEKMWLGWIAPSNTSTVQEGQLRNVTLSPLEEPGKTLAAKIPVGSEYYTVEYRRQILTDQALFMEGVIISYVDESIGSGHGIVRIVDATPSTSTLEDAAFTAGEKFVNRTSEVAVKVFSLASQGATLMVQKGFADLTVQNITVSGLLIEGQEVYFDAFIKNSGVVPSNFASVSLSIDGTPVQSVNMPIVDTNTTVTVRFGPWTAKSGVHSVRVVADASDDVVERNEANNALSKNFEFSTKDIVVDEWFATTLVADVNSTQKLFLHARWNNGSDISGGTVYVNGSSYVANSTGWVTIEVTSPSANNATWHIRGINVNGTLTFTQEPPDPYIIWDFLRTVDSGVSDDRCNIGSLQKVWVALQYAYDGRTFDNISGSVWIGGKKAEWDSAKGYWFILDSSPNVGKTDYAAPSGFEDKLYNLTVLAGQRVLSITWDGIDIILSSASERTGVGSQAPITWTGTYRYDGAPFQGSVTLNDALQEFSIGKVEYTVNNVSDARYGVTVFTSNSVGVVFDELVSKISVNTLTPGRVRVELEIAFKSDGTPANNTSVVVSGKEAESKGDGKYMVEVSNWSPYVDLHAEIGQPYFSESVDIPSVAVGNLALLILISATIIIVGILLIRRKANRSN
jgi:M6 family metalloprotease-like protein